MTLDPLNKAINLGAVMGMAATVVAISIVSLIGSSIGRNEWSSWGGEQIMARSTAVALIILAACVILVCRELLKNNQWNHRQQKPI